MCKPSSQLHSFLSTTLLRPSEELIIWVWRDRLGRRQEFNSQHPHGLQPSRTPELDLTLVSPPSTHMAQTHGKTLLHVKKVKFFFKKKKVILKVFEKHLNKGPPYLLDQIKSILTALTVFSNAQLPGSLVPFLDCSGQIGYSYQQVMVLTSLHFPTLSFVLFPDLQTISSQQKPRLGLIFALILMAGV